MLNALGWVSQDVWGGGVQHSLAPCRRARAPGSIPAPFANGIGTPALPADAGSCCTPGARTGGRWGYECLIEIEILTAIERLPMPIRISIPGKLPLPPAP